MSKTISFVIQGSPTDPRGNPHPKARLTKRQQWTDAAHRYVAWKNYVRKAFISALKHTRPEMYAIAELRDANGLEPIPGSLERAHMTIMAHYKNHKHPDTENVFGSIADSLFHNDSSLAGAFDFTIGRTDYGHVDVTIILSDDIWNQPIKKNSKGSQRSRKTSQISR